MSTVNKHTQGEWTQKNSYGSKHTLIETNDKFSKTICNCNIDLSAGISESEAEANAKIICIAVNNHSLLIEALKTIAVYSEKGLSLYAEGKEVNFKTLAGFIYEKANETIQSIEQQTK